jgi:hypothetical protein
VSYSSKELSAQDSQPVWLVQFVQGAITYRYNTIAETISRDVGSGSVSWYAAPIEIGKISCSGDVPKDALTLRLPYSNTLAYTFVGYAPDVITTVTVWRTHRDDTDVKCMWKGRVGSITHDDRLVTLNCESIFTSIKRQGPGPCYTRTCRFVFGGRGCNVDLGPYTHALTATAATGNVITVTDASNYDLAGGTLEAPDGTIRMIIGQDGDDLALLRRIKSLAIALASESQSVTCIEGCNHTVTQCRDTHNNLGRFGGMPGRPGINPMGTSISQLGNLTRNK